VSAGAEKSARYRDRHPGYCTRNNVLTAARAAALTALSRLHPQEFQRLYRAEVAARGEPPPQPRRKRVPS